MGWEGAPLSATLVLSCLAVPVAAAAWVVYDLYSAPHLKYDGRWNDGAHQDDRLRRDPGEFHSDTRNTSSALLISLFLFAVGPLLLAGSLLVDDSDDYSLLLLPGGVVSLYGAGRLFQQMMERGIAPPGQVMLSEPLAAGRPIQLLFDRPLRVPYKVSACSAELVLLEHVPRGHEYHAWEAAYTLELPPPALTGNAEVLRALWWLNLPTEAMPPRASAPSKYRWELTIVVEDGRLRGLQSDFRIPFTHPRPREDQPTEVA